MDKHRLEAFSDGLLAIIITILVLALPEPSGSGFAALVPLGHLFLGYVLSFVYIGIYWNNHHHMLHTVHRITGGVLWANLLLLFWLSLVPFATEWMGRHPAAPAPTALYGIMLLLAAFSYFLLQSRIIASQGADSLLRRAIGRDWKGRLSPVLYLAGIALAFVRPWCAQVFYALVAAIWLIPDRRIEREIAKSAPHT